MDRLLITVWPEAYRVAATILRDRTLAEDVAQEACIIIARSLRMLTAAAAFPAWSYKIIVRQAISATRKRSRQAARYFGHKGEPIPVDRTETIDLENALATLAPKQRAAVILHYYVGLSSREISDATGLPRSTIRFHLMLARRRLRKALEATDTPAPRKVIPDAH
jgi:RNA polymerase sigma-70 factor (ECF subfamily)